ncbi:MAG: hypothetical protein AAB864_01800 [Patescibacteria group bacterium]
MLDQFQAQLARREEKRLDTLSGTGTFWLLIVATMILLAVSVNVFGDRQSDLGGIGGTPSTSPVETLPPRLYTVSYRNGVFSPTNLRIHIGDTVRFRNDALLPIRIVVDADTKLAGFDSVGDIPQNSYFAFTFSVKGVFGYHNVRDLKQAGTIIVR